MNFMDAVKDTILEDYNTSVTENGALGYSTTGKELLDLNFAVASLRNVSEDEIILRFKKAFYENKKLAIKWAFFARDVRGGLGERRLFRAIMCFLSNESPDAVIKTLPLFAEYGRWDDLIYLLKRNVLLCLSNSEVHNRIIELLTTQLVEDRVKYNNSKPISLLAKWMPSENASSEQTKKIASYIRKQLVLSSKEYRQMLSELRKYIDVTERKMSANEWGDIKYESVPSKANLNYKDAFMRHDEQRRKEYLEKLTKGETKINSSVLFPHEIVARYRNSGYYRTVGQFDASLEEMWKALPDMVKGNDNTMVVADGSGSMTVHISNNTQALDVANALAIYFAEHASGVFKDKYITFSENPQFVDFSKATTLRDKINIANSHCEVANTNIEAVFNLILNTAVKNNLKQEEIPKNILIISDMEFDTATYGYNANEKLFTTISKRYKECGYKLPRLVFWNVNSRTNTIPVRENENGVALVSGFSTNICQMVMSNETDPFKCLLNTLNSKRYDAVEEALKDIKL